MLGDLGFGIRDLILDLPITVFKDKKPIYPEKCQRTDHSWQQ